MLNHYSTEQLLDEVRRRHLQATGAIPTSPTSPTSSLQTTTFKLIVTGVYRRPTKEQMNEIKGYMSRKSRRQVINVTYDQLHKCLVIVTTNTSHGQNFRDDYDWLAGKATRTPDRVYWTDKNGVTRRRGLLQKVGINFSNVIQA